MTALLNVALISLGLSVISVLISAFSYMRIAALNAFVNVAAAISLSIADTAKILNNLSQTLKGSSKAISSIDDLLFIPFSARYFQNRRSNIEEWLGAGQIKDVEVFTKLASDIAKQSSAIDTIKPARLIRFLIEKDAVQFDRYQIRDELISNRENIFAELNAVKKAYAAISARAHQDISPYRVLKFELRNFEQIAKTESKFSAIVQFGRGVTHQMLFPHRTFYRIHTEAVTSMLISYLIKEMLTRSHNSLDEILRK